MDEIEFQRILNLFPVVRSRDYHAESTVVTGGNQSREWKDSYYGAGGGGSDIQDNGGNDGIFWEKLTLAAEKKVGKVEADKFCKAFKRIHNQLVYKELSLNAARSFVTSDE